MKKLMRWEVFCAAPLSVDQSMVVRVAVNALIMDLGARGVPVCQCAKCDGNSDKSRQYLERLSEVVGLMVVRHEREPA